MSIVGSKIVSDHCIVAMSARETHAFGIRVAKQFPHKTTFALFGDLGSGKTTFVRGFAQSAMGVGAKTVCSPTFNYLNIYQGKRALYHFDLYRLPNEQEFIFSGFEEMLQEELCVIEWAEKIPSLLPCDTVRIHFTNCGETQRSIRVES
jgi:tRNA threonylcarbamoyladenosine biosynthesis protein TsaE